ncbi:hypothetical protein SVAN01_01210 [Stagonosporopsis vannaccii]|nr:hypothetical protein SVAN01_01210 [Stagonosporopsis vannaccii]
MLSRHTIYLHPLPSLPIEKHHHQNTHRLNPENLFESGTDMTPTNNDHTQRSPSLPPRPRAVTSRQRSLTTSSVYTTHSTYSAPSVCTILPLPFDTAGTSSALSQTQPPRHDIATISAEEYRIAIQSLLEDLQTWMERQDSLDKLDGVEGRDEIGA